MCPNWGYYFIMDDVGGPDTMFRDWGCLIDVGKAYARGVEFSIQRKLFKNLYGLINLTYYRTRFRDLTGIWRNRAYDNRYIICITGGYKPNKNWEFNLRFLYCGNKAMNAIDEEISIQEGRAILDMDNIMNEYMSDYHTLSLRCDRRFYFQRSSLVLFLGAMNILDHENELYRFWDTRLNDYRSVYMWGMIPYIGFEFEF
jgi:outer membrane receptor for ferrienterochelin and colicin